MGKIFGLDDLKKNEEERGLEIAYEELMRLEEEKKALREKTQSAYRFAEERCKDPEAYFESVMRGLLTNPEHADLRRALGIVAYLIQKHPKMLPEDFEFGGGLYGVDILATLSSIGWIVIKENRIGFTDEFQKKIREVSHHKLMDWMKELREVTHERYTGGKPKKAELVEKGFTPSELDRFFSVVDDPEAKRCYLVMATLGLRLGELCRLKGSDYNPETKELRIPSAKGSYSGVIKLPESIAQIIPKKKPDEPLFNRTYKQLRDRFAIYREKAGLTDVYMYTEPCGVGRKTKNRLYRLTCHSFRHYAIQRFYRMCKDVDLTRRFARHKRSNTTAIYLQSSRKEEVEALLEQMEVVTALSRSESVS